MAIPARALLEAWGEPLGGAGALPQRIEAVSTDSRRDLEGALFVPLVGERFDGHAFLEKALCQMGAVAALAQLDRWDPPRAEALARRSGRAIWPVQDTLAAFQELARLWRLQLEAPVVAVTGSAGKTTTRELIRAALAPLGPVVASSGNENNDVGAPLTLLRAAGDTAAVVVEMGMRGLGEIERLSRCAEPDVAVITNIGTAHIGRLGSREAIGRAKCEITASLRAGGLVVIPAGDVLLEDALARVWSGRIVRVALAGETDPLRSGLPAPQLVGRLDQEEGMLHLESPPGFPQGGGHPIRLPLAGRHNARNFLLALAVATELGVALEDLAALEVEVPGGRSRRLRLGGVEVLDETYNASPEAVLAALDLLAESPGRRFAVLGTMLELGESSLELHRAVARRAVDLGLDGMVIVDGGAEGDVMMAEAGPLPRLVRVAAPEEAAPVLQTWLAPGDRLLLKASRSVALERLIPILSPLLEAAPQA